MNLKENTKKKIVISGINLIDGGPLSVFHDLLDDLYNNKYYLLYDIVILVGNKELFSKYEKNFDIIEYKKAKKSWLFRIYYEYFAFYFLSLKLKPYLWLSMHDMTPLVKSKVQAVYCHNASFSYKMKMKEIKYEKKLFLFTKFYKYLYRINIKRNDYVIVQQKWLKDSFEKMFNIDNVIVAKPTVKTSSNKSEYKTDNKITTFIFAAYPRVYKNFEVICEAVESITDSCVDNFKVYLTIDGTECDYSRDIYNKYSHIKNIEFTGLLDRKKLFELYEEVDCLIFPSKLETWGMPITEFKSLNKPVLAIDLPYAHETIGTYDKATFFKNNDNKDLANIMKKAIKGEEVFKNVNYNEIQSIQGWKVLLDYLIRS